METEGKNKYNINSKNFDYSKDDLLKFKNDILIILQHVNVFNWFVNFI